MLNQLPGMQLDLRHYPAVPLRPLNLLPWSVSAEMRHSPGKFNWIDSFLLYQVGVDLRWVGALK